MAKERSAQRPTLSAPCSISESTPKRRLFCREALEKKQRILGREHRETQTTSSYLATSLSRQGKHADAAKIEHEVLVSRTRLLGAEHEFMLTAATNLGFSLSKCDQDAESEQLFCDMLALSRRALGPTYEITLFVLRSMNASGFAAR